uniref:Uncharacterized protein n=1 Tax=Monopterus albus TaxID=43700 RepID=A0A3Q3IUX8_MONAL
GGWTQDDPSCLVEQFCPEYNEWRTTARMVNNRGTVAMATLDGMIYTAGGEDDIQCYSSVEGVCLVAMDEYLYAIGGHDSTTVFNTVEYDPKMNTWSKQALMLTSRTRAVAAVLDGHLYVIGGSDGDTALSSERYNPVDGTWSICAHMLSPRQNAGCAVYLGHIYVAGGKDELNLEVCAAERFDPDTMRWTPIKHMRSKRMSLVVFSGALLAVGGSDGITHLKTIEVYSHETNTWHFGSTKSKHPG